MERLYFFSKIIGAIILVIGLFLNYQINRRRFYRRNVAGLQQFQSYGQSVVTRWLEKFGKIIAFLLIIGGLLILIGAFLVPGKIQ